MKIKNQIKDIWFLWIYLSFVFITQIFLMFDGAKFYILSLAAVVVSYFIAGGLITLLSGSQSSPILRLMGSQSSPIQKNNVGAATCRPRETKCFPYITHFAITFIILFVYGLIIILFRNHMVVDFYKSFTEAINNQYTNWHPVIFTLIFAKLPTAIFGNERVVTFVFYEFVRAVCISFCLCKMEKYASKKFAIISLLYYMFMPLSIHSVASQTKGTAMGEFFIVGFSLLLQYLYKDDNKKINITDILVGILFALSLLMRKNGVLFFVFIFIGIYFIMPKKNYLRVVLSFIASILIITKVVYSFFAITNLPNSHNKHEALGVPLTVISAFMKYDIEDVDDYTYNFAKELVKDELEIYDGFDIDLGYHSVRWNPKIDYENIYKVFDKYSAIDIIKMAYNLSLKNSKLAIKSIINLTKGVYGFRNWQGITNKSGKILGKNFIISIYHFFLSIDVSFINLFVIATVFAKRLLYIRKKDKTIDKYKVFNLCLSLAILMYSFGTMILLSCSDATHYFMINSMFFPLYILCVYGDKNIKLVEEK